MSPHARPDALSILAWLVGGLVLALVLGLALGHQVFGPGTVWRALTEAAGDPSALIIRDYRLSRAVMAPIIGAALGVSGFLIQTASRNPLASPDLLGVNAGAAFAVVLAVSVFRIEAMLPLSLVSVAGALLAAALVFSLTAATGGAVSPGRTLLAGVTIAALMSAGVQVVLVTEEAVLEQLLFWLSGGFVDRSLSLLTVSGPLIATAAMAVLFLTRSLDALLADDGTARTLGVAVARTRMIALVAAATLAGAAVAAAGPVAFVGLVAPHLARRLVGPTHGVGLAASALLGALLAVAADIVARFVIYPEEAPVGAVLAIVGVPVLTGLLRRTRAA